MGMEDHQWSTAACPDTSPRCTSYSDVIARLDAAPVDAPAKVCPLIVHGCVGCAKVLVAQIHLQWT